MRSVFEMLKQMVMAGLPRQAGRRLPDREREQGALVCCLLAEMGCSAVLCQAKKHQCWTSSTRCHQGKEGTFEPGVVKRAGMQAKKSRHPQVSLQPFVPGAALTAVLDALGYRVGYSAGCRAVGTELLLLCHCLSQGPSRAVLQGFHISSPWRWLAHLCELSSGPL